MLDLSVYLLFYLVPSSFIVNLTKARLTWFKLFNEGLLKWVFSYKGIIIFVKVTQEAENITKLLGNAFWTVNYQIKWSCRSCSGFPGAVKNLPAIQETQVQSLGKEDPLEEKMATRSSILAWRTPWTEEPGRLESVG